MCLLKDIPVSKYKESKILPRLQANKLSYYSFIEQRTENYWVKDKDFIPYSNSSSQSISNFLNWFLRLQLFQ